MISSAPLPIGSGAISIFIIEILNDTQDYDLIIVVFLPQPITNIISTVINCSNKIKNKS